jgi:hypothetical protein
VRGNPKAYSAASFQSIPLSHTADEVFTPPMVTNRRAEAKACKDPVAYRFFQSHPIATAEGNQAQLYLRLAATDSIRPLGELGCPVTYVWRPDRVERHMAFESLDVDSVTRIAAGADAVLIDLRLRSRGPESADLDLFLRLLSGVEKLEDTSVWNTVASPPAATRWDGSRNAFVFAGPGGAFAAQGVDQPVRDPRSSIALAEWVSDGDMRGIVSNRVKSPSVYAGFGFRVRLAPGGVWRLRFVHAIGDNESRVLRDYDRLVRGFDDEAARADADWESEIAAAFTPGNGRFSGCLPTLHNVEEPIERAYLAGVSNLLFMKRLPEAGILRRVYKSISPRSGPTCWLWDTEQAAPALGLLDPDFLREISEAWMRSDIHGGWAVNYLTGQMLGTTYSVNDYALFTTALEYLRFTGDDAWLDARPGSASVAENLRRCAAGWKGRSRDGFIADYGAARHLLECVPTYEHGVASLNAANSWMCSQLPGVLGGRLSAEERDALGREAESIASEVLGRLLREDGTFACLQPDGRMQPVAHCYDFAVVSSALDERLPSATRNRMIDFFLNRLMTPSWMHALAEDDPAAPLNFRTDHSATGAYTSWPAQCIRALARAGRHAEIVRWLGVGNPSGGIAGVARQGPYGQGIFHGGPGSLREGGAARKAPDDAPHYEEWIDVAGGAFVWAILEGVFGLTVPYGGQLTVERAAWDLMPSARIDNVIVRGETWRVDGGVPERKKE